MDDWDSYAHHTWGWGWTKGCFPQNSRIHPSDRDGFVHVDGRLLFMDGKVTRGLYQPPTPDQIMVEKTSNVTCLYVRSPPEDWQPELFNHEPQVISHYFLRPGPWPAPSWNWDRWTVTCRDEVWHLINQWATWAYVDAQMRNGHV